MTVVGDSVRSYDLLRGIFKYGLLTPSPKDYPGRNEKPIIQEERCRKMHKMTSAWS